jgi:hypothetical protein
MDRFIVGTGRCGSTLLSRMLAESPEMASLFEFFNGLPGNRFAPGTVSGDDVWEIISKPHPFVTMVTSRGHRVEEVTPTRSTSPACASAPTICCRGCWSRPCRA